jgi:hypothetical protein
VLRHGHEFARPAARGAGASGGVTDGCETSNERKALAACSSSYVHDAPIVVPGGADGLELLRIVPGEENELSGGPQSKATHPVCPKGENVMQPGKAEQFACALVGMSHIVLESDFDRVGLDAEVEGRARHPLAVPTRVDRRADRPLPDRSN